MIGAGLSGLSAACFALMNGYQVMVLEQHARPGGAASSWSKKGFQLDLGPLLWGCRPGAATYALYRELGVLPQNQVRPLRSIEVREELGGRSLQLASGLEELERSMKEASPADLFLAEDLVDSAADLGQGGVVDRFAYPRDIAGARSRLSSIWHGMRVRRYFTGAWGRPWTEFTSKFGDPFLRSCLETAFPGQAPAWLAAFLLSQCAGGQLGRLQGGSESLVRSLMDRMARQGGEIRFGCHVDRLMVEEGRVTGARLLDGGVEKADAVVSAADGRETVHKLLEGRFVGKGAEARFRSWPDFSPLVVVTVGTSIPFPEAPDLRILLLKRPLPIGTGTVAKTAIRHIGPWPGGAPAGKSLFQVAMESDWHFWYKLRALDRRMYDEEKARLARAGLSQLEALHPGLTDKVEMLDVATPYTVWRYTLGHEGAFLGPVPTLGALRAPPMRTLPGLRGFYMAGRHVAPGPGPLPNFFLGKQAVQLMCRYDGRPFRATAPLI